MKGFVDDVKALEGRTASSPSPRARLPYGDVPGNGTKMLVDHRRSAGGGRAGSPESLGLRWIALRGRTHPPMLTVGARPSSRRAAAPGRPVVAADVADNPGGGFPGDSTVVLRALVELGVTDCAFAHDLGSDRGDVRARRAGQGRALRMPDRRQGGRPRRGSARPGRHRRRGDGRPLPALRRRRQLARARRRA